MTNPSLISLNGKQYVRRPPNKQLNAKYIKKTVKHGGASIMVCYRFSASTVGPQEDIMNGEIYRDIFKNTLSGEYADNLLLAWILHQDNGLKHCYKIVAA